MNVKRRKSIRAIIDRLEELSTEFGKLLEKVGDIEMEEEEYRDNIPENLQSSERYERADDACNSLESAYYSLDDISTQISEAVEELEDAAS